MDKQKRLKIARNGYIIMSVILYVAGGCCIAGLNVTQLTICLATGIILCLYGVFKIVGYLSADLYCLAFQYDLAGGILLMTLGVILLSTGYKMFHFLFPGVGILVLLDSLLTIQTSKDARNFGLDTWNKILFVSIVAGVLGVLALLRPFGSTTARYWFMGLTLIAEGIMKQCVVMYTVKAARAETPEE